MGGGGPRRRSRGAARDVDGPGPAGAEADLARLRERSPTSRSGRSASGRHTSPRRSAIRPSARAPVSDSPRPAGSWPSSPAATRTAPGTSACADSSAPTCSSSTTSRCASCPRPQADDLYELVSERQGRSLITTSDRAPSDWCPLFPNPVVAESLLDRLINAGRQVIMHGPSYRPDKRPRNSTDPTDPPLHDPTAGPSSRPGGMRWHDPLRPPLSRRGSCCICCHCTTQSRNTRRTSITPGRVHPDLGSVLRTNG